MKSKVYRSLNYFAIRFIIVLFNGREKYIMSINQHCNGYEVFSAGINGKYLLFAETPNLWTHYEGGIPAGIIFDSDPENWEQIEGFQIRLAFVDGHLYTVVKNGNGAFTWFLSDTESATVHSFYAANYYLGEQGSGGCEWSFMPTMPAVVGLQGTVHAIAFFAQDLPANFDVNTATPEQLLGRVNFIIYAEKYDQLTNLYCLMALANNWLVEAEEFNCEE